MKALELETPPPVKESGPFAALGAMRLAGVSAREALVRQHRDCRCLWTLRSWRTNHAAFLLPEGISFLSVMVQGHYPEPEILYCTMDIRFWGCFCRSIRFVHVPVATSHGSASLPRASPVRALASLAMCCCAPGACATKMSKYRRGHLVFV